MPTARRLDTHWFLIDLLIYILDDQREQAVPSYLLSVLTCAHGLPPFHVSQTGR